MEHCKFGAFMIQCNKCSRGWSLSEADLKRQTIICQDPECRSEFSVYAGIKQGLKKVEDHISPNFFLANEMYQDVINVKIGYSKNIEFPKSLKKVYKVKWLYCIYFPSR